jgi:hypothetical protein
VHEYCKVHEKTFCVLFGKPEIYSSSGYVNVENLWYGSEEAGWTHRIAMMREMRSTSWPQEPVYLQGPNF